jgi:hypothetical protein
VKQQKIKRDKPERQPTVIDERPPRAPAQITIDPKYANAPVRAVNYVEVGDMEVARIHIMLQELSAMHDSAVGGIHYFVPVRHGKISGDVVFEEEFLAVVNKMCEVKDGDIVLKDGAKEMLILREKI